MFKHLILEKKGNSGLLTINRPKARNALNNDMVEELDKAVKIIDDDNEIKTLIITGAGDKAFMAGADITELDKRDYLLGRKQTKRRQEVFNAISDLHIPTIAAINGYALGAGLELALACTIRISSDDAKFGSPEVNLGIIPGDGATQRLPRVVGLGRAMHMILTGCIIDAQEAERYGLVTKIIPKANLIEEAEAISKTLLQKAPLAIQYAKDIGNRSLDTALPIGLMMESYIHALSCATQDKSEGVQAFLDKRKPTFYGK